jgi:hypothetical protein
MKKKSNEEPDDELRPEYDFSSLRVVARGTGRSKPDETIICLAPDVVKKFPDSESVNEALRFLIRVTEDRLGQNQ